MVHIKQVQKEFNRLKLMCSNKKEAIKEALNIVYNGSHIVHIYLDSYEDFSYVCIDGCILLEDGEVYSKVV
jgi:hypothetical protein